MSPQSLRNWLGQAQIDAGEREGLTSDEREELRRLRRDNARLREERVDPELTTDPMCCREKLATDGEARDSAT